MKNRLATLVGALALSAAASAQTWIWYPGDYEIWLGNQMNNRRTERGAFFPPFWKTDSHYVVVEFSKKLDLAEPEEIFIAAEGKYNVKLDGKLQFGMPSTLKLPAGKHSLNIKVWNQSTPPTIYVKGKTVNTDKTWKVTYEDKEWIDESGKASDTSATVYMDAGCWNFDGATQLPSKFSLARKPMKAVSSTPRKEGVLYDFGKETFGYITLKEVKGKGTIHIYYGESPEEALDTEYCETLDKLLAEPGQITDLAIRNTRKLYDEYTLDNSKAFRYVYVTCDPGVTIQDVSMQYEYLPEEYRGSFKCNDEELNRTWNSSSRISSLVLISYIAPSYTCMRSTNSTTCSGVKVPPGRSNALRRACRSEALSRLCRSSITSTNILGGFQPIWTFAGNLSKNP